MSYNCYKSPVKIFVVDSGINRNVSDLDQYVTHSTGYGINKDSYIAEDNTREVKNLHGTVISLIIRDIFNKVELTSVNILNENLKTDARILIYSLSWCLENKPDIIHLSIGTRSFFYSFPLRKIIKEARKNNILVVAAHDNFQGTSYPASIRGVFGVKRPEELTKYEFSHSKNIWLAPNGIDGIEGVSELKGIPNDIKGNSMAAAYITGHIAKIVYETGTKDFKSVSRILSQQVIPNQFTKKLRC